jgi:hypothetical protein
VEIVAGNGNCQNRSDLITLKDTQHTVDRIREDEKLWVEKEKKTVEEHRRKGRKR